MSNFTFIELVHTFCVVVEHRCHVSQAAKTLHVSQPSVSMQLKRLEKLLKKILFNKTGNYLKLTRDGERFYHEFSGYTQTFSEFEARLSQYAAFAPVQDSLKILGNNSSYNFILPKITKTFLDDHPNVDLTIFFGESAEAVDWLFQGKIDVAILPRRSHAPFPTMCDYHPVFFYRPCLITPKKHPLAGKKKITVQEIMQYDLILPAPELVVIPGLYDIFPRNKISKRLTLNMANVESGRKFVEAGVAITISSDIIVEENDALVTATPLTHLFPIVDYGLLVSKSRPLPKLWSVLKATCEDIAKKGHKKRKVFG